MRSRPSAAIWICAAFCAALGVATVVLALTGTGERGIVMALRATARLAFVLFWPAYAGSALASLFGPAFQPLRQLAREFGLAFAAVMLVHLGLIAWLCRIGAAPGASTFVFFGAGIVWVYVIALFSIGRLQQALGARGWTLLRSVGMNYVALAFAVDFLHDPLQGGMTHLVSYGPFAALAILGPGLRLAALARRAITRVQAPT
jgi:hypothetical protein